MHIIVVGGGLAGLVAALRAVELGARTTLLEKGDWLGGSLVYSSGYVWSYKARRTRSHARDGQPAYLRRPLRSGTDGGDARGPHHRFRRQNTLAHGPRRFGGRRR